MIPTHGAVTSVFHLANAIRHGSQPDLPSWIRAARDRSAYLAAAIDHEPAARFLLGAGLVSSAGAIGTGARLRAVADVADRTTLVAIASMLLELDPPVWLPLAVAGGKVRWEVVPSKDLEGMEWLQTELEQVLLGAIPQNASDTGTLALGIGRAAELAVFAALTGHGGSAIHVSEISDRFGYDIESIDQVTRRWEVKGCTERTAGTFHLSRNEFNKCQTYGAEWRLVQVEFSGEALVAEQVTAAHIARIRELPTGEILSLTPPETVHFRWESSAMIEPLLEAWVDSDLKVPSGLRLPSLDTLGREVIERGQAGRPIAFTT